MKKIRLASMVNMHDQYMDLLDRNIDNETTYEVYAKAMIIADSKVGKLKIFRALVWCLAFNRAVRRRDGREQTGILV